MRKALTVFVVRFVAFNLNHFPRVGSFFLWRNLRISSRLSAWRKAWRGLRSYAKFFEELLNK